MSVVDIMASTILASFDHSILEAVAQELIGVWIANPPGTNLQAIAQPINRFSAPAARSRIVHRTSWASANNAQRLKYFGVSNLEVVCDAKLGAPSMKDCAAVVSLFDQDADRKSCEFDWQDHPLIKMGGRSICFHFRSPIQNWP